MNILALDTSTEICSVALCCDDKIFDRYEIAAQRHTELLIPMIESVLNEAGITREELDVLAYTKGPGSFTGLRITVGVTQGLSLALDIPAIPISTLQVIAQRCFREFNKTNVLVAIDARMNQVYWGGYQLSSKNIMQEIINDRLDNPQNISVPNENCFFGAGNGWNVYRNELISQIKHLEAYSTLFPHSRDMIPLAQFFLANGCYVNAEQIKPIYLRNNIIND